MDLTLPDTSQVGGAPPRQGHDERKRKNDSEGTPSAKDNVRGTGQHDIPHGIHLPPQMPGSINTSMSVTTTSVRKPTPAFALPYITPFGRYRNVSSQ